MTIAEWCVFAAVIVYLLTVAPAKVIGHPRFDNSNPRDPTFYRSAMRSRALGAHLNGIETFPFFAFAVLFAEFRTASQFWVDTLAIAFLVIRLAYVVLYLANRPTLRTIAWNAGFAVNVAIFVSPIYSH
jgi:uncharacterized MAPEG superfamily protein